MALEASSISPFRILTKPILLSSDNAVDRALSEWLVYTAGAGLNTFVPSTSIVQVPVIEALLDQPQTVLVCGLPRVAGDPHGVVDGQRQLASHWAAIGKWLGRMRVKVEL